MKPAATMNWTTEVEIATAEFTVVGALIGALAGAIFDADGDTGEFEVPVLLAFVGDPLMTGEDPPADGFEVAP